MKRVNKPQSRKLLPHLLILFLLAVSLGVLLADKLVYINSFFITGFHNTPSKEAKKAHASCSGTKTDKSSDKIQCYAKYFYKLTKKTNTEFAFNTIYELQKIDTYAEGCHVISHSIGWATYDKDPKKLHELLRTIPKNCSFGAIHGIIERYGKNNKGVFDKAIISRICGEKPPIGCVHAVGHIILVQTENDLEKATKLCEIFPLENNRRRSCLTGVYMERMIGPNLFAHGMITSERRYKWYEHIDEFDALCRQAKGENTVACWEKIALPASIKANDNPVALMKYCDTAQEQESKNQCKLLGLAEILIRSSYDLEKLKLACDVPQNGFAEFKKECHLSLVKVTMLSLPPKQLKRVTDFCSTLSKVDMQECFQMINESFTTLSYKQQEISLVCGYTDEAYRSMCMGKNNTKNKNTSDNANFDIHKI